MLVIREFLDVFLEDLLGVPLVRQDEFRIDLILNVAPISKVLYRLTPLEIYDLSSQLQELLDREFI